MNRIGSCLPGCGACCQWLTLETNPFYAHNADARRWVELHGLTLREGADGRVFARIPLPCTELTEDKQCGLWGMPERPALCAAWPSTPAALAPLRDVCGYSFQESA